MTEVDLGWANNLVVQYLGVNGEVTKDALQQGTGIGPGDLRETIKRLEEAGSVRLTEDGKIALVEPEEGGGEVPVMGQGSEELDGPDEDEDDVLPEEPAPRIRLTGPLGPEEPAPPEESFVAGYQDYEVSVLVTLGVSTTSDESALREARAIHRELEAMLPGEAHVELKRVRTRPRTVLGS